MNLELAFRLGTVVFSSLTAFLAVNIVLESLHTPSALDPSISEWEVCWPLVAWRIGWHICLAINVGAVAYLYRKGGKSALLDPRVPALLVSWFLAGAGLTLFARAACSAGAPQVWRRTLELMVVAGCGVGSMLLVALLGLASYWMRAPQVPVADAEQQQQTFPDEKSKSVPLTPESTPLI